MLLIYLVFYIQRQLINIHFVNISCLHMHNLTFPNNPTNSRRIQYIEKGVQDYWNIINNIQNPQITPFPQNTQNLQKSSKSKQKVKKPIKHTKYQMDRITKGKEEQMFILKVIRQENIWIPNTKQWRCEIRASSSNIYQVIISRQLSCTCPDFSKRKKPCKHIYFMIIQVAQYYQFCDKMRNSKKLSIPNFSQIDAALFKRLLPRIKYDEEEKDYQTKRQIKQISDCTICFVQLNKEGSLFECNQCHNSFHNECIQRWKDHNTTCPLCRQKLINAFKMKKELSNVFVEDLQNSNPLKRLKRIQL